ncbi:MAG: nuclear transport factor 2 family protein [Gammaproteobacteria bacterium]|nr:nuclear transport factor 2 family protein [Gammaproteobacteria bacterium]
MQLRTMILATAMMTTACATVMAGPSDEATNHINAVAAGDVSKIMANYGDQAVFQWVGGPLDGVYSGRESIQGVWSKFAKGNAPLTAKIDNVAESSNPKGSTVSANVIFSGKNTIKVRYVLVYREGKLVNEVWQIDPKLGSSY